MAKQQTTWSIVIVNLVGGAVLLLCVGTTVWLTLLRDDDTSREVVRLNQQIGLAGKELTALRTERDRARLTLRDRERQLKDSGTLPSRAPVEQYFRTLSEIAKRYRLQVLRQNPLPERTYPGLLERRYAYEVSGAMPDIERFFRAIEGTEFWADIGFLKITGTGAATGAPENRVANMTISVFSAVALSDDPNQG